MLRLFSVILMISMWNVYSLQTEHSPPVEATVLEGAYGFVSDITSLTKPKKLTENLGSSDWVGLSNSAGGVRLDIVDIWARSGSALQFKIPIFFESFAH